MNIFTWSRFFDLERKLFNMQKAWQLQAGMRKIGLICLLLIYQLNQKDSLAVVQFPIGRDREDAK